MRSPLPQHEHLQTRTYPHTGHKVNNNQKKFFTYSTTLEPLRPARSEKNLLKELLLNRVQSLKLQRSLFELQVHTLFNLCVLTCSCSVYYLPLGFHSYLTGKMLFVADISGNKHLTHKRLGVTSHLT